VTSVALRPLAGGKVGYVTRIVCLANSFKIGGNCIAGKEMVGSGFGDWVRPVSDREGGAVQDSECRYSNRLLPKLLDIIEIHLLRYEPHRHQTENYLIDPDRKWKKIANLPIHSLPQLVDTPSRLWINSDSTSAGAYNCISADEAAFQDYSLALIRPKDLRLEIGTRPRSDERSFMCSFAYKSDVYKLRLTDPVFISAYEPKDAGVYDLGDRYICVSLTEPWRRDGNRCHKLVAAIMPGRQM
jgi:hypothetical protein